MTANAQSGGDPDGEVTIAWHAAQALAGAFAHNFTVESPGIVS